VITRGCVIRAMHELAIIMYLYSLIGICDIITGFITDIDNPLISLFLSERIDCIH